MFYVRRVYFKNEGNTGFVKKIQKSIVIMIIFFFRITIWIVEAGMISAIIFLSVRTGEFMKVTILY